MSYRALTIAKHILKICADHGDNLTNLKLQKLLYYSQAWYLALNDETLFSDDIEAWVHGPVVSSVYQEYKKYRYHDIDCDNIKKVKITNDVDTHVREVLSVYGGYSAFQLESLAHSEDPWKNARKGIPIDELSNEIISKDDMKNYYRKYLDS